jgi:hypothetical protein
MDADERLRAGRLAAQRLTPATACKSAEEAALAVIGVQAQDLRAAALALRSRVPGRHVAGDDPTELARRRLDPGRVVLACGKWLLGGAGLEECFDCLDVEWA